MVGGMGLLTGSCSIVILVHISVVKPCPVCLLGPALAILSSVRYLGLRCRVQGICGRLVFGMPSGLPGDSVSEMAVPERCLAIVFSGSFVAGLSPWFHHSMSYTTRGDKGCARASHRVGSTLGWLVPSVCVIGSLC